MTRVRVCHFSSVHPADDVRIFHKECTTLAAYPDFEVHFVGNPPLDIGGSGVIFHSLPLAARSGRLKRMLFRGMQAYRQALAVDADIYHFHDPELLPWGWLLKLRGRIVIYDAHEDVPRDILTKAWIPNLLRKQVANFTERVENFIARRLDVVITATPFIRDRFAAVGATAVVVNNFPKLGELDFSRCIQAPMSDAAGVSVCYTGAITEERGALQMLSALSRVKVNLLLAGKFSPASLREEVSRIDGWQAVRDMGLVKRDQLPSIFANSFAGLVLFHPVPNNINSQPNKLFEYMSAGLPVVASNFPLWRKLIDEIDCGLCVDPLNPHAIAEAICWLRDNPDIAKQMGERGKRAVLERFNWETEGKRLIALYKSLVDRYLPRGGE